MASTTRAPRRRRVPATRRGELIDAGVKLLNRRGRPTRVEDVARAAGAAKGTFYLYFSTWDDFLVAVRDQVLDDYNAEVRARVATPVDTRDWAGLVADELGRFVDFQVELGPLHQALFHGPAAEAPIDPSRSAISLITAVLTAGIDAGAFRPVDVEIAAPLVFAAAHSAADLVRDGADRDRATRALADLILAALRPAAATRSRPR